MSKANKADWRKGKNGHLLFPPPTFPTTRRHTLARRPWWYPLLHGVGHKLCLDQFLLENSAKGLERRGAAEDRQIVHARFKSGWTARAVSSIREFRSTGISIQRKVKTVAARGLRCRPADNCQPHSGAALRERSVDTRKKQGSASSANRERKESLCEPRLESEHPQF